MLVGFLCHFTSVLCSMVLCFWAAFGCGMVTDLLYLVSGAMTWLSHLRPCVVSLAFITNELIPWNLTSTSISHFVQIYIILIYHFQVYSGGKLPWLEQKEEEEEKKERTGFSKILSDLLGMSKVRQSSVQIKTWIWHWSVTRAREEVKHAVILSLRPQIQQPVAEEQKEPKIVHFVLKLLHTFFFCTFSASFECIYIFGLHSLLMKKVLKLDHMNSFLNFKE